MAAKTLTVKEVAEKMGTDGRTLRKFLRHQVKESGGTVGEDTPGKGGRYAIEAKKVAKLQRDFAAWNEARRAPVATDDEDPEAEEETESVEDEVTDSK